MVSEIYPRAYHKYVSLPMLGPVVEEFSKWVKQKGYEDSTIKNQLNYIRHIEAFLQERGAQKLQDLTCDDFEEAWTAFCRKRKSMCGTVRLVESFLMELHGLKPPTPPPVTPICCELNRFGRHLRDVRGLADSTIRAYMAPLKEFLEYVGYDGDPQVFANLTLRQIDGYLENRAPGLQRGTIQNSVSFLRTFLRFQHEQGVTRHPLHTMIDSPRIYQHERLPRALPWETVRALLASIDRSNPRGIRNYTILLLMATYGLRSSEVVLLTLDDIDWNAGVIRIHQQKTGGSLVLPLIDEAGGALVEYLEKGRPEVSCRELFLRQIAPSGPMREGGINRLFHSCITRSGLDIPQLGPHCIRHSLAVHMLREGATLKTIGDLLGHKDARSTCIYLRLATEDLRDVALPVPGGPDVEGPLDLRILLEQPDSNGEKKRRVVPQPASFLAGDIESFASLKHALGLKYKNEELSLRTLDSFIMENYPSSCDLTAEIFNGWCSSMSDLSPATRKNHMRTGRNFCLYRRRFDENAFVPSEWIFPYDDHKFVPYIFSEAEVASILSATRFLKPCWKSPLRAQTIQIGVLLMYTTGMRSGELLNVKLDDFNSSEGTLLIRDTKFHKSRVIPMSPSVILKVEEYLDLRREKRLPLEMSSPLVLSRCDALNGKGYTLGGFRKNWAAVCTALGIFTHQGQTPRLHDLRHSFAVNALKRWYEEGVDAGAKLPMLSTYMGHVDISSTHYYIPFANGVKEEASARFHSQFGLAITCQSSNPADDCPGSSETGGAR